MTVNAPFGQRAGLRRDGIVRYLGWAVPEAVYVDYDVIRSAPAGLNRAGVGDILCYRTAHLDWRLSRDLGKEEPRWPYDEGLVAEADARLTSVLSALDAIHDVTDGGIHTLMEAHRWGVNTFHAAGWNPRHIEGVEHFLFYNLEHLTGQHFIHGQPVGLGTLAVAVGEETDTVEEVYEPFLLKQGLLQRTPRGRVATPRHPKRPSSGNRCNSPDWCSCRPRNPAAAAAAARATGHWRHAHRRRDVIATARSASRSARSRCR